MEASEKEPKPSGRFWEEPFPACPESFKDQGFGC